MLIGILVFLFIILLCWAFFGASFYLYTPREEDSRTELVRTLVGGPFAWISAYFNPRKNEKDC